MQIFSGRHTERLSYLYGMAKNGFAQTLERIRLQKRTANRLERTSVRAGWIDGAKTIDGKDFAVIARTLCYGRESGTTRKGWKYPAIPARDFMRGYRNDFGKRTLQEAGRALQLVFRTGAEYQADLTKMLASIGAVAAGGLKQAIAVDRYKQNARSTILSWAKRHSNSTKQMRKANRLSGEERYMAMASMKKELVDTGSMVQHITSDVVTR